MSELRTEAEAFAIALELGFVPVSEAVAWSDAQIAASDVPHIALCDVSMSSHRMFLCVVRLETHCPFDVSVYQIH